MALGTAYPFGLRDIKLTPFTDETTEALGTSVDLPASRTLTFTEAEDFEPLRGDDKTLRSRGLGASVDWDIESGGVPLDAIIIVAGGTNTLTGTTPNQVKRFRKLATDARPYFRAEGQAMSDAGGDVHVVLFRCRATGDIEWEFSDGSWTLTSCSGEAFPSQDPGTLDALYDIIQNETVTAIGTAARPNEIQSLTEGGSGLTSYTITLSGQTTASIDDDATAAEVESALEALSTIGEGNVSVTGGPLASAPFAVEFINAKGGTSIPLMSTTPTGGTGTVVVAEVQAGG